MARIIRSYMPADFEFLAGGMSARIEDSTLTAKTGIPLGEFWRERAAPAEDVAPRRVDDIQLLAVEGFHRSLMFSDW